MEQLGRTDCSSQIRRPDGLESDSTPDTENVDLG